MADRVIVLSSRPGIILKDVKINIPRPREKYQRDKKMFKYVDDIKNLIMNNIHAVKNQNKLCVKT